MIMKRYILFKINIFSGSGGNEIQFVKKEDVGRERYEFEGRKDLDKNERGKEQDK